MADEQTYGCIQGAAPIGELGSGAPTKGCADESPGTAGSAAAPKKAKGKKETEEKGD